MRRPRRILTFLLLAVLASCVETSSATVQGGIPSTTTQASSIENEKVISTQTDSPPTDSYGAWGRLLAAMAIVIGLIVALGWLVKRLGGSKSLGSTGALKLIARATLSPKHQMFLVRMGNRLMLIGAGPQGLATLSEITDAGEAAQLLRAAGFKDTNEEGAKA